MATAALGAIGASAYAPVAQTGVQSGGPSSYQGKDHVLLAQAAPPPRLLPGNAGGESTQAAEPNIAAVRLATRQVEQAVRAQASSLAFSVEQLSGKTVVKVTDSETGQVLRQIPSDEMLSLAQTINSMQGLLLSQKA